MVHSSKNSKNSVRYRQFQRGYAKVPANELRAVLEGYRQGVFRRNEVRVFAARWEATALHKDSPVSLYRIVNCQSKKRGRRRLSHAQIDNATAKLNELLPEFKSQLAELPEDDRPKTSQKPVARRVLRHVARGGATTVEALFYFAYFMRRIPKRWALQLLKHGEHYARFRYADFEAWTGVHRATQSRLFQRILSRGYLDAVAVHKENENINGQLFVDGPMLSLVRRQQSRLPKRPKATEDSKKEMSTPATHLVSTTPQKKSTLLYNGNPKTEIKRPETVLNLKESRFAGHADPELRRIALRAAQMTEQCLQQAA